jgi:colicin import membrane protein
MQASSDPTDLKPPRPGRWPLPLVLALVAHGLLIAALTWGVHWQQDAQPVAFEAELWSNVAQEAAPREVAPPPPPPRPPEPKVEPKVEPKPIPPKPEPKVEPDPAQAREAQIAIEKAQKKKEEEARKRAEEKKAAKKKADEERAKALEEERKKKAEQAAREKREKQEKLAEEKKRRQAQEEASRRARDEQMRRILGQAGATGDANARGTAQRSSSPSASYAQKLSAAFKRNIYYPNPQEIAGNPKAEVSVTVGPTGRVMSARLTRSSGVQSWDAAVLRAAEKTTIPPDESGRFPSSFPVTFGPKD